MMRTADIAIIAGAPHRAAGRKLRNGPPPWRIEEACWNAFPSLQQVLLGNWLLRFGEGLTRRANSINPLGNPLNPGCEDIAAAIAAGEALYHAQGLPVIFR